MAGGPRRDRSRFWTDSGGDRYFYRASRPGPVQGSWQAEFSLSRHARGRLVGSALGAESLAVGHLRQARPIGRDRNRIGLRAHLMSQQSFHQEHLRRVAITGPSGLIGRRLAAHVEESGYLVHRLVRTPPRPSSTEISWDPRRGAIDRDALEGISAVVHLAGENIASGRWTAARKKSIRDSRVEGTRLLCEALAGLEQPPATLIAASAIGYYGDRGDEILTEESGPGQGFLAEVCQAWEAATEPAHRAGIRVVNLRIGVVLSATGGALGRMLTPFKWGLGGKLGNGRQYMSWLTLEDLIRAIRHLITNESASGPVNAVAPNPVTNAEFTKTLGRVLGRPAMLPVPALIIRRAFGEMGRELLLASSRVEPAQLRARGFQFRYPELEGALRSALGR